MKEYIEREAVKDAIGFIKLHFNGVGEKSLLDIINEVPAADVVERKRGRWHSEQICGVVSLNGYVCSVCGGHNGRATNFCHNCGADMRGVGHETD